ncbi:MAG: glycosyltransferase family 9 protein [Gemmatimonadales bacterium]|jgi:heptosyltransferase I
MRTPSSPLVPEPRSVCVVLLTGIGDVVHGVPVVNALRARFPNARVTWVAEPAPADVLRHHPAVDRIVTFRKTAGLRGVTALRSDLRAARPFDVTINAQRHFKSVWPTMFSGAPVRLGLARDKTRDGVSLVNTHHLPDGPWRHTQDIFLRFLDFFGVERPAELEWGLTFSPAENASAAEFFERTADGRPRVGLVTGTANPRKDWPAERYPSLVEALDEAGWQVFLLGGPSERERAVAELAMRDATPGPVWAMADTVRELMWRIRGLDLLISPDTGPVHIARALGVPVVGLYGHTNPWRVGPYEAFEDLVIDVYTDPGETPGPAGYEPKSDRMETIGIDDVMECVARARERYVSSARGR